MKNLTLEHIAAACHGTYYGPEEKKSQCIEAVTTDSRKIEKKLTCSFRLLVQEQTVTNYRSGHGAGSAGYLK